MSIFKKDERLPDAGFQISVAGASGRRTLAAAFAAGKAAERTLLMPFLVTGYPTPDDFLRCVEAASVAGADVLEAGIPFSDPIMDGPVIAAASNVVLHRGQTLDQAFDLLARASQVFDGPIVAMTYYNLLLRRGLGRFAKDCAAAGLAGVIVPDLTPEESLQWSVACQQAGIESVYLASITSSDDRLARIANASEGFIYAASTLGVTGLRAELSGRAKELVVRLRAASGKPVAVGIGVSTPEQAAEVGTFADGVIVGSALVHAIDASPEDPAAGVGTLVASLRGALA